MSKHTLLILTSQLKAAELCVEAIEAEIAANPPDTSDQLFRLRELQNNYWSLIVSLKAAISIFE
jgi:hypothetical protein